MWGKLTSYGLSSTMLNILRIMYDQASSRVTLNSETYEFLYRKGIRQGCNLSPLLFAIQSFHQRPSEVSIREQLWFN